MNLSDQVVSLELAKKLKELGVKQKSLFYWIKESEPYIWYNSNNYPMNCEKWYYSAFTASELGDLLPEFLIDQEYDEKIFIICDFYNGIKRVLYASEDADSSPFIEAKSNTEADARAKMLIHLIESGLMKAQE